MALRTVVENHSVSTAIDIETKKHPGLQDLFDGLKWRLARNPEVGYPVPGSHLFVVHSLGWARFPGSVVLAYSFDDNEVVLYDVRIDYPENAISIVPAKSA